MRFRLFPLTFLYYSSITFLAHYKRQMYLFTHYHAIKKPPPPGVVSHFSITLRLCASIHLYGHMYKRKARLDIKSWVSDLKVEKDIASHQLVNNTAPVTIQPPQPVILPRLDTIPDCVRLLYACEEY